MIETKQFKKMLSEWGADLIGIASLHNVEWSFNSTLIKRFPYGISLAVRLSNEIVEGIEVDNPTPIYAFHYGIVNNFLDFLAIRTTNYLQKEGYRALPIPSSQIINEDKLLGEISHRTIAEQAGLGWRGKSQLLITPEFGPRVRLVTILTNGQFSQLDEPLENNCGSCRACEKACPVGAIKQEVSLKEIASRDTGFHVERCDDYLWEISANPQINDRICGVCMKVCPKGKI